MDRLPAPLILALADAAPADWRAAVEQALPHRPMAPVRLDLVRCSEEAAPEEVIVLADAPGDALAAALAPWGGTPPGPVLLLTPPPPPDADLATLAARAATLGVHHWAALPVAALAPAAVALGRAQARAAAERERGLREALAGAQARLDERKWVERAKGVLMSARGIDEDAAFRLLRGAAMNVNLRVGELARAVFESARWADAMNRAGQLRMLSQRCVRLAAQRLLRIDVREAAALSAQTTQRVRENLAMLATQCAEGPAAPACAAAQAAWDALAQALAAPRVELAALPEIDRRAGALLQAAEALTEALQQAAGRRALHIVNECGRQRLRVQRIAKDSLLAALHPAPAQADMLARRRDAALGEFERALRELEEAPLSTPDIRATLAQVHDEWLRLLAGLRGAARSDGRRAVVHASEVLVERLDALTAAYEHSLQVLMG